MIFKGIDSLFEVAGGILLLSPTKIARYAAVITQHEVFRHHQALAGRLDNLADTVSMRASVGEAAYLMVHGGAKVILIAAIVAGKRWGYTGFIAVLSLFTCVELVRAVTAREVVTGVFGLFDMIVVVLIYKEYKQRFPSSNVPAVTSSEQSLAGEAKD